MRKYALLFALLAMLPLLLLTPTGAEAQTPPALALTDLQHDGLTIMTEAVVISGGPSVWFQRLPRSPVSGSLAEGDPVLVSGSDTYPITAVVGSTSGNIIRFNENDPSFHLRDYFNGPTQTGDDGEGGDLVVLIQTARDTAPVVIPISANTASPALVAASSTFRFPRPASPR